MCGALTSPVTRKAGTRTSSRLLRRWDYSYQAGSTVDGQTVNVDPRQCSASQDLPPGKLLRAVSSELLIMQD